jgi:transposase
MPKRHNEELRRVLLELVTAKGTTIREAATRAGVSYSTATRWVHRSRVRALVPTKPTRFAQLVRETEELPLLVRVGRAEIAVRRGADLELLQQVVQVLGGTTS